MGEFEACGGTKIQFTRIMRSFERKVFNHIGSVMTIFSFYDTKIGVGRVTHPRRIYRKYIIKNFLEIYALYQHKHNYKSEVSK